MNNETNYNGYNHNNNYKDSPGVRNGYEKQSYYKENNIPMNPGNQGNQGNPGYKILSSNVPKTAPKKPNQGKSKQISINISEQSPQSYLKITPSHASSKGDSTKLISSFSGDPSTKSKFKSESHFEISGMCEESKANNSNTSTTNTNIEQNSRKKYDINELLLYINSQSQHLFMMNFLIEKYGEDKINALINKLSESKNPWVFLDDASQIEPIVGEDYKSATNFLKIALKEMKSNPNCNIKIK